MSCVLKGFELAECTGSITSEWFSRMTNPEFEGDTDTMFVHLRNGIRESKLSNLPGFAASNLYLAPDFTYQNILLEVKYKICYILFARK